MHSCLLSTKTHLPAWMYIRSKCQIILIIEIVQLFNASKKTQQNWLRLMSCREWCTHSWMVPAESLLPDGQSIVQQVGCLLVFVLVSDRQKKTQSDSTDTDGQNDRQPYKENKQTLLTIYSDSPLLSHDTVKVVLQKFPQSMQQSTDKKSTQSVTALG